MLLGIKFDKLMDGISTRDSCVIALALDLTTECINLERRRFQDLLRDVNTSGLDWKPNFMLWTAENYSRITLFPIQFKDIPDGDRSRIRNRIAWETRHGFFARMSEVLFALRCTIGDENFINCIYIKMLKIYLDTVGYDVAFENPDGNIWLNGRSPRYLDIDVVWMKRVFLLINAIIWQYGMAFIDEDMLLEVVSYLFKDPFKHMLDLKDMLSLLKTSIFIGGSGLHDTLVWTQTEQRLTGELRKVKFYNSELFSLIRSDVEKSLSDLVLAGLPLTSKIFRDFVFSDCKNETIDFATTMGFIEGVGGFLRGDAARAVRKQALDDRTVVSDSILAADIISLYEEMVVTSYDRGWIPSIERWKRNLLKRQTTRSAGGPGYMIKTKYKGKQMNLSLGSKMDVTLIDPLKFATREHVMAAHTVRNPGVVGIREVPARNPRMILPLDKGIYDFETMFTPMMYQWLELFPQFTVGEQFGRVFEDHYIGLLASSNPKTLLLLADFSAFDAWQMYDNVRRFMIDGWRRGAIRAALMDKRWGEFKNVFEVVELIWEKYRALYFSVKSFEENIVFKLQQVNSGEYPTLAINSMTNEAYWRVLIRSINNYGKDHFYLNDHKIMGDDSIGTAYVPQPEAMTALMFQRIKDIMTGIADRSGLLLKPAATILTFGYYEYLKNIIRFGWVNPRVGVIGMISAEKAGLHEFIVTQMISYRQKCATAEGRGYKRSFLVRWINALWLVKRAVHDRMTRARTILPFFTLYTPMKLGGIGMLPKTVLGSNNDLIIALMSTGFNRKMINDAAWIMNDTASGEKGELAKQLYRTGIFKKSEDFLSQVRDHKAYLSGKEAIRTLMEKGVPLPPYHVDNVIQMTIRKTIETAPTLKKLNQGITSRRLQEINNRSPEDGDLLRAAYPWLKGIIVDLVDEEIKPVMEHCPIRGLDPIVQKVICRFGVSGTGDVYMNKVERILAKLRQNDEFPSFITVEAFMSIMSRPALFMNEQNAILTLMAMGVPGSKATIAVKDLYHQTGSMRYAQISDMYSLGGGVLEYTDQYYETKMRAISSLTEIPDRGIKSILADIGWLISFHYDGLKRVSIHIDLTNYDLVKQGILREDTPANKFIDRCFDRPL